MDLELPVIIKPAYHECRNRLTRDNAWRADNRAQLLRLYDAACTMLPPDALISRISSP